jgi:hypothetical protein
VSGGEEELVKGTEREQLFRYWGLAAGGIYFVEGPRNPLVQFVDLGAMRIKPLFPIRRAIQRGPRGMAVAPDGSEFLYLEDDLTLSDIMLIENTR